MRVKREARTAEGIRFSIPSPTGESARAYLYLMHNDLHTEPFGLLEDVYVEESKRGSGIGSSLVQEVIAAAREAGCYKLIATSRHSRPLVHDLYRELGFKDHGLEFRLDFDV